MGGFCGFSVKLSPVVYCIAQDAHAQHLNIATTFLLLIGEFGD